jgi:succinate dehydrogenase/fumarate reductase flavoprotein subunit
MSSWQEYVSRDGHLPEWPYPIRYEKENEITTDVLILGGGISGCHAAISAAKKGVKVAIMDKGPIRRSGSGGGGVDHWLGACTNPCSRVTVEEVTLEMLKSVSNFDCGLLRYINLKESWDCLLECEQAGVQIRDVHDQFVGAPFRDNQSKLMFAYDLENRYNLRIYGHNMKPALHQELKRLGVQIYDRVMVTSLLTDSGRAGGRVVGATAINVRTGEFYVFKAKATVLALGAGGSRTWVFSTELNGAAFWWDMNHASDAFALGWEAGAEFAMMDHCASAASGGFRYIPYGVGNPNNTWYGCSIVDANGKELPWLDRDGKELKDFSQRYLPTPGQKFIIGQGEIPPSYNIQWSDLPGDLPDRIRKREFVLPLFADLTGLPVWERHAIFGLMVGNECKTRIPVYDIYTRAGFDPDKDMLQVPLMPPDGYQDSNFWDGLLVPHWRRGGDGGLMVDWDLKTNLEGLYAGHGSVFGHGAHSTAATSGRYAGRKAADYARIASEPVIARKQVDREKVRVYAPVKRKGDGIGWKELNAGIARVMQDYCGQCKNEETLNAGLRILRSLRESEMTRAVAANPHELMRTLECFGILTHGEMEMHAALARKASSQALNFYRLDYPEVNPPEWNKLLPIRLEDERVVVRELPLDYHLRSPYANDYEENYRKHCGI